MAAPVVSLNDVLAFVLPNHQFGHSDLDAVVRARWAQLMRSGASFRYQFHRPLARLLPGKYGFWAQFNPMRATMRRPPEHISSVTQAFDPDRFHFGLVSEDKELICRIVDDQHGSRSLLLINVSPIEFGHCLLIPEVDARHPQVLTLQSIVLAVKVMASSRSPSLKMAFNSLCAYASVNHLHWHFYYLDGAQLYLETVRLPSKLSEWCHEIRLQDYSAPGFAFQVRSAADLRPVTEHLFRLVSFLSAHNVAHNVFMTRGWELDAGDCTDLVVRIFVWARLNATQTKDPKHFVMAVCELAGQLLIYNQDTYDGITESDVVSGHAEACSECFQRVKAQLIADKTFHLDSS